MKARVHLTIQCSRCDRTTLGSGTPVLVVASFAFDFGQPQRLEFTDIRFDADAHGEAEWLECAGEAYCPDCKRKPQTQTSPPGANLRG